MPAKAYESTWWLLVRAAPPIHWSTAQVFRRSNTRKRSNSFWSFWAFRWTATRRDCLFLREFEFHSSWILLIWGLPWTFQFWRPLWPRDYLFVYWVLYKPCHTSPSQWHPEVNSFLLPLHSLITLIVFWIK